MLLLLDKPQGYTSFDIVRKLQKLYPKEPIWHAGTLDPMATWLLIVAIGKDTKTLGGFLEQDKTYITTIDVSQMSDTWDLEYWKEYEQLEYTKEGLWKEQERRTAPTQEQIQQALQSIVGTHPIPLTPFSAKKVWGKKLYEYAREWNPIFIDIPMTVHSFEIVSYEFPLVKLKIDVGSGTYIRSIGYWLGKQFGLWGLLTELRRTRIWKYNVPEKLSSGISE